jgi:hypothetical protein
VGSMLREHDATPSFRPAEEAGGSRSDHEISAAGPTRQAPPPCQGRAGHSQSDYALDRSGGSRRPQRPGHHGQCHRDSAPTDGPGALGIQPFCTQAGQPALHINMLLDFKKELAKSSTGTKRWRLTKEARGLRAVV